MDQSINRGKIAVRRSVVIVLRGFVLLLNEHSHEKTALGERFVAKAFIWGDGTCDAGL